MPLRRGLREELAAAGIPLHERQSEPVNDWNTRMPDTREVNTIANALGAQGFDVHTAIIRLNNGGWDVEMQWTDSDMQDGMTEFTLGNHGRMERI